jgi:RNA recognition motif-containing protein
MNIEVTNLNVNLIEADLQRLFTPFGEISSVVILRDKFNNRSKGKAVIQMPVRQEAQKAVASLMGYLLGDKKISVTERPATEEERSFKTKFI